MADLEEKVLRKITFEEKSVIWWRYIEDIFFITEHGEECLERFVEKLNNFHSTIEFAAEYSNGNKNFLDLDIRLVDGELMKICLLNLPIHISF